MSPTLNRSRTGVLAGIAVAGPSCINKYSAGPAITCADHVDDCASVPGCRTAAACQAKDVRMARTCGGLTTQPACEAAATSDCAWSGDACDTACASITDPNSCDTFDPGKGFPCIWSTCSGVPDKPSCGDYSIDQCPSRLNCQVMQSEPVGT